MTVLLEQRPAANLRTSANRHELVDRIGAVVAVIVQVCICVIALAGAISAGIGLWLWFHVAKALMKAAG